MLTAYCWFNQKLIENNEDLLSYSNCLTNWVVTVEFKDEALTKLILAANERFIYILSPTCASVIEKQSSAKSFCNRSFKAKLCKKPGNYLICKVKRKSQVISARMAMQILQWLNLIDTSWPCLVSVMLTVCYNFHRSTSLTSLSFWKSTSLVQQGCNDAQFPHHAMQFL